MLFILFTHPHKLGVLLIALNHFDSPPKAFHAITFVFE